MGNKVGKVIAAPFKFAGKAVKKVTGFANNAIQGARGFIEKVPILGPIANTALDPIYNVSNKVLGMGDRIANSVGAAEKDTEDASSQAEKGNYQGYKNLANRALDFADRYGFETKNMRDRVMKIPDSRDELQERLRNRVQDKVDYYTGKVNNTFNNYTNRLLERARMSYGDY